MKDTQNNTWDLMVDIETLGTEPGCVILSVAMIWFDIVTKDVKDTFYTSISLQKSLLKKYTVDADTLKWWITQNTQLFMEALSGESIPIVVNMMSIKDFMNVYSIRKIWAKSPAFDLSMLKVYFNDCSLPIPWKYNQEADVRTYCMDFPETKEMINSNPHNPEADCLHQINQVCYVYNKIYQL